MYGGGARLSLLPGDDLLVKTSRSPRVTCKGPLRELNHRSPKGNHLLPHIFGGSSLYTTGVTRRLSRVLLMRPPMSTMAKGLISGLVL